MTEEELKNWLQENSETRYRDFTAKLVPNAKNIYGIRLPKLRKFAKQIAANEYEQFCAMAVGNSLEETMLRGLVIAAIKEDTHNKQKRLSGFVSKIDNWSVCDCLCASLKKAKENRQQWWDWLMPFVVSKKEFVARFGIVMLLFHFIETNWVDKVLQVLNRKNFPKYYAQMAAGWAIAEAYAKYPEKALAFLQNNNLQSEVQNKAIRKICESLRISAQEKQKVRMLKK